MRDSLGHSEPGVTIAGSGCISGACPLLPRVDGERRNL